MGSGNIMGAFSSDSTLSTPVAINKGGTGQTTAQAALDALAAASGSLVQGDVFIVDASGNVVRLARGSDNQTLVMNGSNPNWETVSSGGATVATTSVKPTASFTTSSTSFTDITGMTVSMADVTSGKCITTADLTVDNSGASGETFVILLVDDTIVNGQQIITTSGEIEFPMSLSYAGDSDGTTAKLQMKVSANNGRMLYNSGSSVLCQINSMGVG